MNRELKTKIQQYLENIPGLNSLGGQQGLIYNAGLDPNLINSIQFNSAITPFLQLLFSTCERYGTQHDGRNPVVAILEASKDLVGVGKKKYCNLLIHELTGDPVVDEPYNEMPLTPSQPNTIETVIMDMELMKTNIDSLIQQLRGIL